MMSRGDPHAHVLLVSTPGWDRELYASALGEAGFTVSQVDTLELGVTHLAESEFALIIVDLLPAPATTWAFIESRRASDSEVPIVVFTPLIRPDGANRCRARELGCAAFVAKPCSVRQLVAIVARVHNGERGLEVLKYSDS